MKLYDTHVADTLAVAQAEVCGFCNVNVTAWRLRNTLGFMSISEPLNASKIGRNGSKFACFGATRRAFDSFAAKQHLA
jgi:hypothetical protein